METMRIAFEPFIEEGARQFIVAGLDNQNSAASGLPSYFPANFVLRGEAGDVLGGLLGLVWGHWLHVTTLWITEGARGRGHGTRLMRAAEAYAVTRGAVGATLETHSFQARPFYERLGYEVFGALEDCPRGHTKFFLRKRLG